MKYMSINNHYPVRPALNETYAQHRRDRLEKNMRRKNMIENIKWVIILFMMGLAATLAPLLNIYVF